MSTTIPKFVAETQPFLLHQYPESLNGSVKWIQTQLGCSYDLWRTIPAIGTVNQYRLVIPLDGMTDNDG
jgi:hypothetical protein